MNLKRHRLEWKLQTKTMKAWKMTFGEKKKEKTSNQNQCIIDSRAEFVISDTPKSNSINQTYRNK